MGHRFFLLRLMNSKRGRSTVLMAFDVLCFLFVEIFYYWIAQRASGSMPVGDLGGYMFSAACQLCCIMLARIALRIYRNVWRYANAGSYFSLVLADAAGSVLCLIAIRLINLTYSGLYTGLWQVATVGSLFCLLSLMARFSYSLSYRETAHQHTDRVRVPVAIIGAGQLGLYLAGDLKNNPNSTYLPMFFIDNSEVKIGSLVAGLKVYGVDQADGMILKLSVREVFIAITQKSSDELSALYNHYSELGCKVRVYESLVSASETPVKPVLRDFSIEDLLFRQPIEVTDARSLSYYQGKVVLVTGGGGSIGSELCRQIAACGPKQLVIFDIYENNAYEIQQELIRRWGGKLNLVVEIGSVRDPARLDWLFARYRPQVVFHAAAHKHVPLMEHSGGEAIKNNVLGTKNAADAAEHYGAEKFILVSTDKAVNPTNIMGASKRMCEMIVQCRVDSRTAFAAVRFGNVLGSNGSVIPLFKRQIAEGGPVTITDKRIIRYFMTIPEASQLVIQAGAMAQRGELFVLDMGKPVKIYDLAVNMIRLSGLRPGQDIEVKEIGLRPGEKLYEELLMKSEEMHKTDNELIFIEHDNPYSREEVDRKIAIVSEAVRSGGSIKAAIARVVPTYHDPEEVNRRAQEAEEMKQVQQVPAAAAAK